LEELCDFAFPFNLRIICFSSLLFHRSFFLPGFFLALFRLTLELFELVVPMLSSILEILSAISFIACTASSTDLPRQTDPASQAVNPPRAKNGR